MVPHVEIAYPCAQPDIAVAVVHGQRGACKPRRVSCRKERLWDPRWGHFGHAVDGLADSKQILLVPIGVLQGLLRPLVSRDDRGSVLDYLLEGPPPIVPIVVPGAMEAFPGACQVNPTTEADHRVARLTLLLPRLNTLCSGLLLAAVKDSLQLEWIHDRQLATLCIVSRSLLAGWPVFANRLTLSQLTWIYR